ncbi:hypothetical protein ACP70R_008310 [Stipagrostis hirtigluma subsp. patula]
MPAQDTCSYSYDVESGIRWDKRAKTVFAEVQHAPICIQLKQTPWVMSKGVPIGEHAANIYTRVIVKNFDQITITFYSESYITEEKVEVHMLKDNKWSSLNEQRNGSYENLELGKSVTNTNTIDIRAQ